MISVILNISYTYQNLSNKYPSYYVGENAKKYFPELTRNNKWQLYTGEQPHKFLDKLNLKFDFLFLDTVHFTPGELINTLYMTKY